MRRQRFQDYAEGRQGAYRKDPLQDDFLAALNVHLAPFNAER
jgi:hypothetical protein